MSRPIIVFVVQLLLFVLVLLSSPCLIHAFADSSGNTYNYNYNINIVVDGTAPSETPDLPKPEEMPELPEP